MADILPPPPPASNQPVPSISDAASNLGGGNPSGGGDPNQIFQNIQNPAVNILPFLDNVAKQAQILTAATTYGDSYGPMSAAKPSPKPFVVGFIAPDVPVNYIPVKATKKKIADVNSYSSGSSGGAGPAAPYAPTGKPGLHPKQLVTFKAADLKAEIIAAYTANTGHAPTEQTVALIFSQMCIENSANPAAKTFSCYNYNLGNYHAGGGKVNLPGQPKGNQPLPAPDLPKGGSYYLTADSDQTVRPIQWYSVYQQNFDNLHDATGHQVGQLLRNWPGTATAQTPEDFNRALAPGAYGDKPPGSDYFQAPKEAYLSHLQTKLDAYYAGGSAGGPITPGGSVPVNVAPPPVTTTVSSSDAPIKAGQDPVVGAIMDNGDVCGADVNPLDSQFGQNIAADATRQALTNAYTASIIHDINTFKNTPPLLMMINPSSFERSYEASSDSGTKGRQGPIVHVWLEKPLVITCKGTTAAHYIVAVDGTGGLAQTNRIQSISYQNLLSLVLTYKNNGIIFDGFSQAGNRGVPIIQMSIFIYYDGKLYIGSFDDFSVDDAADKPYNMEYSFKFTVRYEIEVSNNVLTDSSITAGL